MKHLHGYKPPKRKYSGAILGELPEMAATCAWWKIYSVTNRDKP
jgi:hypothetical protein